MLHETLTTAGQRKYTNNKPDITAQITLQESQVLPPLCWSNKENNFSSFQIQTGRGEYGLRTLHNRQGRVISQSDGDILMINNVPGIISYQLTGQQGRDHSLHQVDTGPTDGASRVTDRV